MADVSPLLQALYAGRKDEAEARAAEQPELDVFEAAALGRSDRVRELLARDASLANAVSPDGFTGLHLAAFFGSPDAALVLVDGGAEIDAVAANQMRVTPLHSAAAAQETTIARFLIERGADVNARQEGGFTPLHAAAQNGDEQLVEILFERDADRTATTDDGRTAAEFAAEAGHADLAQRLR